MYRITETRPIVGMEREIDLVTFAIITREWTGQQEATIPESLSR